MLRIIRELTPLCRVLCSSDYDRAIELLQAVLPFRVLEYSSADEYNGWVIPPKWDLKEARVIKDGRVVWDGLQHPLAVISLSRSFRGTVDLDMLKQHLHYDHRYPDAIPFHFRQQYRSWDRDWGFCVPRNLYERLEPGQYDVIIETEEAEGVLKVLDFTHRGEVEDTFAFVAHLDHPGMANDDLSGCAVGIELFHKLSQRVTKYTYKLLIVPEIIGSEYYLGRTISDNRNNLLESLFLESLGTSTQLALQQSRTGGSCVEWAVGQALENVGASYRKGAFRSIIGNDETVWEAYGIPMASLSRFPYPEYHCDRDDLSIISSEALAEAARVLLETIDLLETTIVVRKIFHGTICLANPKYDLYIDPGQPALGTLSSAGEKKLRLLMDIIPTLDYPVFLRQLARETDLPESAIRQYLDKWAEKGLLELR